jgi:hypothetical protein
MSFLSKGKFTIEFDGQVTIEVKNGKTYLFWGGKADYKRICFLAKHYYNIKTNKKRIVQKYVRKFINVALKRYIDANP